MFHADLSRHEIRTVETTRGHTLIPLSLMKKILRVKKVLYYDSCRQGRRIKGISGRNNSVVQCIHKKFGVGKRKVDAKLDSRFQESGSKLRMAIAINEPLKREREEHTNFQDVRILIETRRSASQEYFLMATTICSLIVKFRGRYW